MSRKYEKRYTRKYKRAARKARQSARKAKNLQLRLGIGHLYFLKLGSDLYGFSVKQRDTAYIKDIEALKTCIFGNIPIKNMDTGDIYSSFEEYRKEKLIIRLAEI